MGINWWRFSYGFDMSKLILLSDFRVAERSRGFDPNIGFLKPEWYFPDCYHNSGSGGGWHKEIVIESGFPHRAAIHEMHFENKKRDEEGRIKIGNLKIGFRRFIDRNCSGLCLYSIQRMDYAYLRQPEEKYRYLYSDGWNRSKVEHGYHCFDFEEAGDQMLFALKFADLVSPVSKRHPNWLFVSEDEIEHAEREKWKGSS